MLSKLEITSIAITVKVFSSGIKINSLWAYPKLIHIASHVQLRLLYQSKTDKHVSMYLTLSKFSQSLCQTPHVSSSLNHNLKLCSSYDSNFKASASIQSPNNSQIN